MPRKEGESRRLEFTYSFNKYLLRAFHVPDGDIGISKTRSLPSWNLHFYGQSQGYEFPLAAITNYLRSLKHINLLFHSCIGQKSRGWAGLGSLLGLSQGQNQGVSQLGSYLEALGGESSPSSSRC